MMNSEHKARWINGKQYSKATIYPACFKWVLGHPKRPKMPLCCLGFERSLALAQRAVPEPGPPANPSQQRCGRCKGALPNKLYTKVKGMWTCSTIPGSRFADFQGWQASSHRFRTPTPVRYPQTLYNIVSVDTWYFGYQEYGCISNDFVIHP